MAGPAATDGELVTLCACVSCSEQSVNLVTKLGERGGSGRARVGVGGGQRMDGRRSRATAASLGSLSPAALSSAAGDGSTSAAETPERRRPSPHTCTSGPNTGRPPNHAAAGHNREGVTPRERGGIHRTSSPAPPRRDRRHTMLRAEGVQWTHRAHRRVHAISATHKRRKTNHPARAIQRITTLC